MKCIPEIVYRSGAGTKAKKLCCLCGLVFYELNKLHVQI